MTKNPIADRPVADFPQKKQWLLDREVEAETQGRISASRLRKDRLGAQLFPFHRVGRSCYYDLREINEVIAGSRFGGRAQRGGTSC